MSTTYSPNNVKVETLKLEISAGKLAELLMERKICAADLNCLDQNTRECVKKLCLQTSLLAS